MPKFHGGGGGGGAMRRHPPTHITPHALPLFVLNDVSVSMNFEYNDRRNKIIPKEVQAKHPRASSVTNA